MEDLALANDALPDRAHESHRLPSGFQRDPASFDEATYRKKPMALLVGYDGTLFKGNTVNHELPRGSTVDDVLEDALFRAGNIVLSNYRSRGLSRLKWSRSSRTDKGVSSLATVVSCRLEVDPDIWNPESKLLGDFEARRFCEAVNGFLPETVKVFAAFSTPKSFQARRACVARTYEYLLPARCLGYASSECVSDRGSEASHPSAASHHSSWPGVDSRRGQTFQETLRAFREALAAFEGSHYFHNYTRRAAYARSKTENRSVDASASRPRAEGMDDACASGMDFSASEGEEELAASEKVAEDAFSEDAFSEDAFSPRHVGSRRDGVYWLLERDDDDLVGIKHNRRIHAFVAGDVETLPVSGTDDEPDDEPEPEPFVRVTVRGDSFMLHQIRKMIATAVAAALGHYPPELIPASLARPARIVTPIAPPMTLYLRDAEFVPFAKNKVKREGTTAADVAEGVSESARQTTRTPDPTERNALRYRLDRLEPSRATRNAVDSFRETVLDPALGPALRSDAWRSFTRNLFLSRVWTREGKGVVRSSAVSEVLEAYASYAADRSATRKQLRDQDEERGFSLGERSTRDEARFPTRPEDDGPWTTVDDGRRPTD